MKKTIMNYEAPVAEMIELQASMVLMNSGGGGEPGGPGGSGSHGGGTGNTPNDPGF